MTAITLFPNERETMRIAERKIRCALIADSPGSATLNILKEYTNLSAEGDRVAFVSVLATRLAIRGFGFGKCFAANARTGEQAS